jgi:hypothetical protein
MAIGKKLSNSLPQTIKRDKIFNFVKNSYNSMDPELDLQPDQLFRVYRSRSRRPNNYRTLAQIMRKKFIECVKRAFIYEVLMNIFVEIGVQFPFAS